MGCRSTDRTVAEYTAPGTASSSTSAAIPGVTSSTSVSSTEADRPSIDTSVTVRSGLPAETGVPTSTVALTADPDDAPEAPPPPARAASDPPPAPPAPPDSWPITEPRSPAPVAEPASRRASAEHHRAGDRGPHGERVDGRLRGSHGGPGLRALSLRQRRGQLAQARQPRVDLLAHLAGLALRGPVVRLGGGDLGQRLRPEVGVGDGRRGGAGLAEGLGGGGVRLLQPRQVEARHGDRAAAGELGVGGAGGVQLLAGRRAVDHQEDLALGDPLAVLDLELGDGARGGGGHGGRGAGGDRGRGLHDLGDGRLGDLAEPDVRGLLRAARRQHADGQDDDGRTNGKGYRRRGRSPRPARTRNRRHDGYVR